MQTTVLVVTLVLMAVAAGAFGLAAARAGAQTAGPPVARWRNFLIIGLLVLGVIVSILSLRNWPYAVASEGEATEVKVSGAQWWWEIDVDEVPLGKPVTFLVTSEDVNHGMGVYDAEMRLLFQTQGMPGYVNRVSFVFDQPGTYRVLCMEFCGIGHHDMVAEFEVVKGE